MRLVQLLIEVRLNANISFRPSSSSSSSCTPKALMYAFSDTNPHYLLTDLGSAPHCVIVLGESGDDACLLILRRRGGEGTGTGQKREGMKRGIGQNSSPLEVGGLLILSPTLILKW